MNFRSAILHSRVINIKLHYSENILELGLLGFYVEITNEVKPVSRVAASHYLITLRHTSVFIK